MSGRIDLWRRADRFVTDASPGIRTRHLLSFSQHYDPDRIAVGPLVAHNDELLAPGSGFDDHRHREVEIVTWVVEGQLRHRDDTGNVHVVDAGGIQVLSAGSGIVHSEHNADQTAGGGPVRFVQSWLRSDPAKPPAYAAQVADAAALGAGLVPVASSRPEDTAAIPLRTAGARLLVGALDTSASRVAPASPLTILFVVGGPVSVPDHELELDDGDTLVVRDSEVPLLITARSSCTILVWQFADADSAETRQAR